MAGGIKKTSRFNDLPIVGTYEDSYKEIFYCTECKGEKNRLYQRANYEGSDADQWLQCRVCASIFNKNDLIHTGKLEGFTVPSDNPYERRDIVIGLDNKRKLTPRQRDFQRLRERISKEKDPDIRDALRRGAIVTIVEDSMNY